MARKQEPQQDSSPQHSDATTGNNDATTTTTTTSATRVCIKNVPLSFTKEKLIQHFSSNCKTRLDFTDCRILKTKDGKSRRLAFMGFKSPKMAQAVVSTFHQTYAQTSKLSVEYALHKKQALQQHRPWSKHSVGSSRYQTLHPEEEDTSMNKSGENDNNEEKEHQKQQDSRNIEQRKQEFLSAMGLGGGDVVASKQRFWANDHDDPVVPNNTEEQENDKDTVDTNESDGSDDDSTSEEDDIDSVDSGGKGADVMQSSSRFSNAMSDLDFLKSKTMAVDNLTDEQETNKDVNKDDSKMNEENEDSESVISSSSVDSSTSDSGSDESKVENHVATTSPEKDEASQGELQQHDNGYADKKKEETTNDDSMLDPCRLFCRNLPFACKQEELEDLFTGFGNVVECHLAVDDLRNNKGFAFVTFDQEESATKALHELDGCDFQGRLLHVMPAKQRPVKHDQHENEGTPSSYKRQLQLKRKQQAASSQVGANASFVRGDAVVDNLSDRLGISKGAIFDLQDGLSSGDAAVRLALGETHILQENRDYFSKNGIDMEALVGGTSSSKTVKQQGGGDKKNERSTTSILVKNLPYDKTNLDDITKLFHGVAGNQQPPNRILLPPSRTIALVEYDHSVDARRAFQKLAYKRFKHVPLYLEWAPLLVNDKSSDSNAPVEMKTADSLQQEDKNDSSQQEDDMEDVSGTSLSHTIFVKNLNFTTTEDQLRDVFGKHVSNIRAVKIPTKLVPVRKQSGKQDTAKSLSMGYGFVECDSDESARKAIKTLQGALVDGHALQLKPSTKQLVRTKPTKTNIGNTKLIVRNVPFQASRTELLKLFGSFGHLKKVRLPKKFNGSHRGFAFLEFTTNQEAQTAVNSLSRTHLYGRHLVLEWASQDNDDVSQKLQEREQVKRHTSLTAAPQNKKIRFH